MNGTFKSSKTGEIVLPEDQREYVLNALGLAVVAEKEETEETIKALIDWFFQGMEWHEIDGEDEEQACGNSAYDDYISVLEDEAVEEYYRRKNKSA